MELLACIGVMNMIDRLLESALALFHLSPALAPAFSGGLFEVTLGAKGAGAANVAGLRSQMVAAAWILSWAGLSVHAQIASIMNECDMRYLPFLAARVLHSLLAAGAAYFLFRCWRRTPRKRRSGSFTGMDPSLQPLGDRLAFPARRIMDAADGMLPAVSRFPPDRCLAAAAEIAEGEILVENTIVIRPRNV